MPELKAILEALLLAAGEPLALDRLLAAFPEAERPERDALRAALAELAADCAGRGVELVEVASGFRLQVPRTFAPWVSRLWEERAASYSRALLETLALIAYRQPVTRGEIEAVRGVSVSSSIMKTLQERGWIRVIGHREVPGRPALYATTRAFLDYFNLRSLSELPPLAAPRDLDALGAELERRAAAPPEDTAVLLESPDG
jgi:segregation and condensation protein B